MIDVCLAGTGGMMPMPDRFLTSLYLRSEGRALLIDCGESTQTAMRCAELHFKPIEALLLTHYHADHVSGLPGLLLTLANEARETPLHVYGPNGLSRVISAVRVIVPELSYEIVCHELDNTVSRFEIAGLNITAFPAVHRIPCLSYMIEKPRAGKFDLEKAKRLNIPLKYWSRLQAGEEIGGYVPSDVMGAPRRGLKILYSTDTRPLPACAELGADADLMILEGMFGEPEKLERALLTRHETMQEACRLASDAHAKCLWLTHYSPANPHPEEFEAELKQIFENLVISTDGQKTTLKWEE